jgi:hypothetical protein
MAKESLNVRGVFSEGLRMKKALGDLDARLKSPTF